MKRIYRKSRKPARKPAARRICMIIAALVPLVVSAVALSIRLYSVAPKLFPVREIAVSGNRHLTESELISLAGVRPGDGLIGIPSAALAERLSRSSWVRAVSVRKEFPERLLIKIEEAVPFAILDKKGQSFLIDEKGKILEKIGGDPVPFLPVITADPVRMHESFIEAIRLAGVLKEKKIATERNRVEIVADGKGPEDLSVIIDSVVIKIGYGDYEQKLDRLFALEGEIKKRAVTVDYVDLRFANRVVVRPISEVIR